MGVDIIPHKYCNFDCIYCQIGKSTGKNITRKQFFQTDEIVKEVVNKIKRIERVDYLTFSGSGEPTLNENIGAIIREVKNNVNTPVAVITNSSLLSIEGVRKDLMNADVVLPSLDAASDLVFNRINRPLSFMDLKSIIEGIKDFRKNYEGKIWLEVMLIKGINDDPGELQNLRVIVEELKVDKIHLNTVTRPPSEKKVFPLDLQKLEQIREFFGDKCEIISSFEKNDIHQEQEGWAETLIDILKRRSLTLRDITTITGASSFQVKEELNGMEKKGSIKTYRLGNEIYYTALG